MKHRRFKKIGWFYLPVYMTGLLMLLGTVAFMMPGCMAVVSNGHPVSPNVYEIFACSTATPFWWKWVAEKTLN